MPDSALDPSAGVRQPLRLGRGPVNGERTVAVIGAGFSGTLAAINLRHSLPADFSVHLFERSGRFARGPAYAGDSAAHLLNVRSANMSGLPDDPGHFDRWLDTLDPARLREVSTGEAGRFATRRLYGRYLRALLYEEMLQSGGRVLLCADEVQSLRPRQGGWELGCASGRAVPAAAVVIAAGNLPSGTVEHGVVFHDPWRPDAVAGLRPGEPVLIVGTGLSMVDLALAMRAQGFAGPIIALSRRGLVPQRHRPAGSARPWQNGAQIHSLVTLLRRVRAATADAEATGADWRAVIDGMRPVTARLWCELPVAERERFLRHLRPFWDVHRHRMAPAVADRFDRLVRDGMLEVRAGRVRGIDVEGRGARVAVRWRGRDASETIAVQRVIYATGTGAGSMQSALLHSLRQAGLAQSDAHGLGLAADAGLRVLAPDGMALPGVWALGPIVRGVFWECTAVPDIRLQARQIGQDVAVAMALPQSGMCLHPGVTPV